MNRDSVIEKFELLADGPDAVAKVRQLILSLAVRGRLVPQSPDDEPAEELVRRIIVCRLSDGEKRYADVCPTERPYEIPSTWTWATMGNLSLRSDSGWSPQCDSKPRVGSQWGILKVSAVSWGRFLAEENKALPADTAPRPECEVRRGDFLLSRANTAELVARSVIVDEAVEHLMMSDKIVRFTFSEEINPRYINMAHSVEFVREYYARNASGTSNSMKNVGRHVMCNVPLPIPPRAEQQRIVAKVDELMGLCDRLEAQLVERETRQAGLVRASLAQFAADPTPANLAYLFHPSYHIPPAELRKTILTLAVQGKLVPQNGIKTAPITNEKRRFAVSHGLVIPDTWGLLSLSEAAEEVVDCPHSTPQWTNTGKICVRTNQFSPGFLDLSTPKFVSEETYKSRIQRLKPRRDDILYSREGGILGIACRVPPDVELCLGQRMMLIRGSSCLLPAFLEIVLNSPLISNIARHNTTGGAAPRINVSTVRAYPVPIPPLAEQRRIVAKVADLMGLIDDLERCQNALNTSTVAILDGTVRRLTG